MRFMYLTAALAAPLLPVLAAPATTTTATGTTNSTDTANTKYDAAEWEVAMWRIKEQYPGIADADAQRAAEGYLEAIHVQTGTKGELNERGEITKRCCSGCARGNCIIAIFLFGFCCIGS